MTTTADKMRNRVISLMERARHNSTGEAEALACREKAAELVTKYALPASLLTDPTPIRASAARSGSGFTAPVRTYPCRFGCGTFMQHTADEMAECAARKRAATGRDSAYDVPPRSPLDDMFDEFFASTRAYNASRGHRERASYTRREDRQREKAERFREAYGATPGAYMRDDEPKAKRRQTSHAHCDHEPTKAARARCRKEGGPSY